MEFLKIEVNSANVIKPEVLRDAKLCLNGKEGANADKGRDYLSKAAKLIKNSMAGSPEALKGRALLNAVWEVTIPSKVEQNLGSLLSVFGNVERLTINSAAKINVWERERNGGERVGAKGSSGTYNRKFKRSVPVTQEEYTSFYAIDYRDLMDDPDGEYAKMTGEITTDIVNGVVKAAETSLVDGMTAAVAANKVGAIYLEAAGINQSNLDVAIAEVRTGGKGVSIFGDFRAVKQITAFVGIGTEKSEKSLVESDTLGYITNYIGADVLATDNFYDYQLTETAGGLPVWAKQLSKANVYVVGKGESKNPNYIFLYGGATTMTGKDIANGSEVVRVDQLAGTYFFADRAQGVAIISDTNLQ